MSTASTAHSAAPFSASDRSTWSDAEREFKLDLTALSVESWSHEQRKSLLFLLACCLPTVHNRARAAARRTARHQQLPAIVDSRSDGGQWEEEYLRGIATVLTLEQETVEV